MKNPVLLIVLLAGVCSSLSAQQTYLQAYGQIQTDINRSHELVQLDDTTFVLGGEWNGVGFLLKVNHKGDLKDYFFIDNYIPGNSAVKDLTLDPAGNIIATGECDHCVPGDTLKKVFAIATEPSLLYIASKIYEGTTPSNNLLYTPAIARKGNQLILAASAGGPGLNFEDVVLMSITANLDTIWRKTFNSCSNCGFDYVADIVPTGSGYALLVLNAFTDSLTLYHVNDSGSLLWKKRHAVAAGSSYLKMAYRSGVIYVCGSEPIAGANPAHTGGFIRRYSETNGNLLGSMNIDIPAINDEVVNLRFSTDGTLLAVHRRAEPNSFGTYLVSRIYRVNSATNQIIDFTQIPNPDVLTNMGATSVLPLKADGSEFAACGIRGFYNRSFFYSKNSVEPAPPGMVFDVSPDTACAPATLLLTNNINGAAGYSWFLDGVLFSSVQSPPPLTVTGAGLHEVKLQVQTGTQNKITSFIVNSLPEIWNECPICDNKPDPYLVIKNAAGAVLYTSAWVESYPPVALPVSFTLSTTQQYKFEIWDDDNVGSDDFFGVFNISGNTTGGTFSLTNPGDPDTPLTITFATQLLTQTQTHTQTVLVYQPSASLTGNVLTANPGNPAPPVYTWQWYLNGQPITGATAATLAASIGGNYAVAMVTPGCSALSNTVQYSPALTAVSLETTQPLCFGEMTGSLFAQPIGGTPPYAYAWDPASLSGSNPTGLPAGTYAVTVTDANGQTVTAQATLTEPDQLIATATTQNPACFGEMTGSILVSPTGGAGTYTYTWEPATLSGNNPADLSAGTYGVTITDANGCTATAQTTLTEPEALVATATAIHPACFGEMTGSILVSPTGGTGPFDYVWEPAALSGNNPADLPEGSYSVTITDANGCTATASETLEAPPALTATTSATPQDAGAMTLGTATVTPGGGAPLYSFAWNTQPVQTTETATGLPAGNYTVTVTDANGCTLTATAIVDIVNAVDEMSAAVFRIYPNPTAGRVFIETSAGWAAGGILEIFNPVGKVVRRETWQKIPASIDLAEFPSGVYLISLKTGTEQAAVRVILQR
jgi:hypothetical protein